jgi:hypothetical protein
MKTLNPDHSEARPACFMNGPIWYRSEHHAKLVDKHGQLSRRE